MRWLCSVGMMVVLASFGCAGEPPASRNDGFDSGGKAEDPWGWSHVRLQSSDGIGIGVDFIVNDFNDTDYKPSSSHWADPAFVNVWGPGLTGDEAVRVVLMNYEGCSKTMVPFSYAMDLQWYGDHFSGDLAEAEVTRSYLTFAPGTQRLDIWRDGYAVFPYCQEIAVVVDGTWQVDPVSSSHNFGFDMYAAR